MSYDANLLALLLVISDMPVVGLFCCKAYIMLETVLQIEKELQRS